MLKKITISLLFILPLVALGAKPERTTEIEIPLELSPKEYISSFALKYKAPENELMAIAKCESNFNPNAFHKDDGGKDKHSVGIFQYQEATFNSFSKMFGEELDYFSYYDQIKLTSWIFANHPELKSHWSCFKMI